MTKKITGILLMAALLCGQAYAHSGKPDHHVIIDTDGGPGDMRAITMFLSDNDTRVLAITCSKGTLPPFEVFSNVNSLLSAFHHEGIPVGISEDAVEGARGEDARGEDARGEDARGAGELLNRTLKDYPYKVTLVALGSLKTFADWVSAEGIGAGGARADRAGADRAGEGKSGEGKSGEGKSGTAGDTAGDTAGNIDRIIWYNDLKPGDANNPEEGFNYRLSPGSYETVKQSGIPLHIVAGNRDDLEINRDYLDHIHNDLSIYATRIEEIYSHGPVTGKNGEDQLSEDLVPLYLNVSILFDTETADNIRLVSLNRLIPADFVYETIGKILSSSTVTHNRVFNTFPTDTALYKPDYARIVNSTIKKFGLIEWKAISMTNEIHGHTGIYSIIGAKMGIRAMEYFNVGINNMEVTTFAGNKPPLSCFNDGIQISTGATIGQGLITVSDSVSPIPSANFVFNRHRVNISVKPEIAEQMRGDIKYGVETFGLLTEQYWLYIEELAIRYWTEFDRQKIFIIK